jgi:hypothetical protein
MCEGIVLKVMLMIAMLSFSVFMVTMALSVFALAWRSLGIQVDRKKAIEAIEEKARREKAEREMAKVGRIVDKGYER